MKRPGGLNALLLAFLILTSITAATSGTNVKITSSLSRGVIQQGGEVALVIKIVNEGNEIFYPSLTIKGDSGVLFAEKYGRVFDSSIIIGPGSNDLGYYLDQKQAKEVELVVRIKEDASAGKHYVVVFLSSYNERIGSNSIDFEVVPAAYKQIAQAAISDAKTEIDNAQNAVNGAKEANTDVKLEEGLLKDAAQIFLLAKIAYDQGDFGSSLAKANEAKALARQAETSITIKLEQIRASKAIETANNAIVSIYPILRSAQEIPADISQASALLNDANERLASAQTAYANGKYSDSITEAMRAIDLSEQARIAAETSITAKKAEIEAVKAAAERKERNKIIAGTAVIFAILGIFWYTWTRRPKRVIIRRPYSPLTGGKLLINEMLEELKDQRRDKLLTLETLESKLERGEILREYYDERARLLKEDVKKLDDEIEHKLSGLRKQH
ncbi:MAG: hypothetical protein HY929_04820 [Euryarchaeota archaeon]|nr:hypothetical protein [Euryarchaeota archaeon]